MTPHNLVETLDAWNEATSPYAMRTEHEHHRQQQRARAADNRIRRNNWEYRELDNGRRIPDDWNKGADLPRIFRVLIDHCRQGDFQKIAAAEKHCWHCWANLGNSAQIDASNKLNEAIENAINNMPDSYKHTVQTLIRIHTR